MRRQRQCNRTARPDPPPLRIASAGVPPPLPPHRSPPRRLNRLEYWAMLDVWCAQLCKCASFGFNESLVHGNGERRLVSVYLHLQRLPRAQWDLALVRCRQALELLSVVAIADPRAWFELLEQRLHCGNLPTDGSSKHVANVDSKYNPILPRFLLELPTASKYDSDGDDARSLATICSLFFGVATGAGTTTATATAARGFVLAKAAVERRLTPVMLQRLRLAHLTQRDDNRIVMRVVFRPPPSYPPDALALYLDDIAALVAAIQQRKRDARQAPAQTSDTNLPPSVFGARFPFKLDQVLLDLHDTIALPSLRGVKQLVALVQLGVQITQDGIWSPARWSVTPATSTLGRLSVMELAPLLQALTGPRVSTAQDEPPAQWHALSAPGAFRNGPLDINYSLRQLSFVTRNMAHQTRGFVQQIEAICAAISASDSIQDVEFMKCTRVLTGATRRLVFRWLAFALFSRNAASNLKSITLMDRHLKPRDMRAMLQVATARDPIRLLSDRKCLETIDNDDDDERREAMSDDGDDGYYGNFGSEFDDDEELDELDGEDLDDDDALEEELPAFDAVEEVSDALIDRVAQLRLDGIEDVDLDDGDLDNDDDDVSSDTVVLHAGTRVRVGSIVVDTDAASDDANSSWTLDCEMQFRIICNARERDAVDILVPCYGACTVLRADVAAFTTTLLLPAAMGDRQPTYSGSLEALDLSFSTGTAASTYLPLIELVGAKLQVLRLTCNSVLLNDDVARILAWCPNLTRLSLAGTAAGVAQAFVDAYRADRCKITDLFIANLTQTDATTTLLRDLQDPTTTAAKTLTKSFALRPEAHDEATLLEYGAMLERNSRLEFFFMTVPTMHFHAVGPRVEPFNRQLLPSQLVLDAKLAFLSVIAHCGYVKRRPVDVERAAEATAAAGDTNSSSRNSKPSTELSTEVVGRIFQFAAERRYRTVLCYPI